MSTYSQIKSQQIQEIMHISDIPAHKSSIGYIIVNANEASKAFNSILGCALSEAIARFTQVLETEVGAVL